MSPEPRQKVHRADLAGLLDEAKRSRDTGFDPIFDITIPDEIVERDKIQGSKIIEVPKALGQKIRQLRPGQAVSVTYVDLGGAFSKKMAAVFAPINEPGEPS